jgi:molybdopterin-guanine dinucleotide biosynthesis protein A
MREPKHLLVMGGQTLLARAVARLRPVVSGIVVSGGGDAAGQWDTITDTFPSGGPLAGIHAALAATGDTCAVVACDMPFFSPGLLALMEQEMGDALVAVPKVGPYHEPLHAVYRPECENYIRALFEDARAGYAGSDDAAARAPNARQAQSPRVADLFPRVKVHVVEEDVVRRFGDPGTIFFNINKPRDYVAALQTLERMEGQRDPS